MLLFAVVCDSPHNRHRRLYERCSQLWRWRSNGKQHQVGDQGGYMLILVWRRKEGIRNFRMLGGRRQVQGAPVSAGHRDQHSSLVVQCAAISLHSDCRQIYGVLCIHLHAMTFPQQVCSDQVFHLTDGS